MPEKQKPKTKISITAIMILSFALVFIVALLKLPKKFNQTKLTNSPVTPTPTPFVIPKGETIEISGVVMKNFYKTGKIMNKNNDVEIKNTNDYSFAYFPLTSQFNISIIGTPFEDIRKVAEEDFINELSFQGDFCSLNIIITTPRFANPDQAGQNYKLSKCE